MPAACSKQMGLVWALTLLLAVPVCMIFPYQVHLKTSGALPDWSWNWVFWPYWFLASLCLGSVAFATWRGTNSNPSVVKQAAALRTYNVGFLLLLALPLTGAGYLDGILTDQIAMVVPGLVGIAGVAVYLMNRSRPCNGGRKARKEEE